LSNAKIEKVFLITKYFQIFIIFVKKTMIYKKKNPRISVKYVNSDTDDVLFEINDRNHSNVGELLSDYFADNVIKDELSKLKITLPKNIMILCVAEFELK